MAIVALAALGARGAAGAPEPLPKDIVTPEGVLLRLEQVEMDQVVDLYSRITDRVVLPAPDLKGKITIINRHRIKPLEAARLIESAFELQGWTMIPSKKATRLVKSKDAVKRMVPMIMVVPRSERELANTSRIQTHLVALKYATGEDVKTLISPLLSNDGTIQLNHRTNLLVITEVGTNMSRLLALIAKVDRPLNKEEETFDCVQLHHVAPKKMVEDVKEYFKGTTLTFLPNERLNLLVLSGRRLDVDRAAQVIRQLDRPVDPEQTVNQIVRIRYAKATDVAELVSKLYKNRLDQPPPSFSVNSDKASNTLIVTGPPELRAEVARLIDQVDKRYDQVLLKALVGEVSSKPTRTLGVQWEYLRNATDLAQNFGSIYPSTDMTPLRTGTVGIRYSVIHPSGYSHFVNALELTKGFTVVASPQIAVATNKTATFKVIDQVPVQTAERTSDNSNVTVRSNDFKEVGLTLKATPAITPNKEVSLDLDFTFSEVGNRDAIFHNFTFVTRQTQTSVIIADEHTLVIAGLMRRDHNRTETRVPWLGRMPVLGPLFRNRSDENSKQELLVLLTPTIMETPEESEQIARAYQNHSFSKAANPSFVRSTRESVAYMKDLTKVHAPVNGAAGHEDPAKAPSGPPAGVTTPSASAAAGAGAATARSRETDAVRDLEARLDARRLERERLLGQLRARSGKPGTTALPPVSPPAVIGAKPQIAPVAAAMPIAAASPDGSRKGGRRFGQRIRGFLDFLKSGPAPRSRCRVAVTTDEPTTARQ
jgi:general secretion pathway protein D